MNRLITQHTKTILLAIGFLVLISAPIAASAVEGYGDSPSFLINGAVAIDGRDTPALENAAPPSSHYLDPCSPNPFNPITTIKYGLFESALVDLKIYDLTGRLVRTLVSGVGHAPGRYQTSWDGTSDSGLELASGVYLYRMQAGNYLEIRRMTLLK
jgi:FlgD Ig-like domain